MRKEINKIFEKVNDDHVSEFSAQTSYYIILAFVPFLILLISLIQFTEIDSQTLYSIISYVIPSTMKEMVLEIIQEVYSKSYGTISIAIFFTLWSAGKGFFALNKGLNNIYEIEEEKYIYLKVKSMFNTIILLILITLTLILLVFGNSLIEILQQKFNFLDNFCWELLAELGYIVFTFFLYIAIYMFIPRHNVKMLSQIPGAFIGSIGLNIISFIFSKYLSIFKGFSIMYGSLTTIMLIIMWTYTCIYTLFFGAEINKIIDMLKTNDNNKLKITLKGK